eukprot:scaffold3136_cov123-Isochrysis_galbana.AAC.6
MVAWGLRLHSTVHTLLPSGVYSQPSAGEVVEGGALLALFVEEANAVGEALARLGWGGAKGVADVDVLGLDTADLAVVEFLLFLECTRADTDVVAFGHEFGAHLGVVALAPFGVVMED